MSDWAGQLASARVHGPTFNRRGPPSRGGELKGRNHVFALQHERRVKHVIYPSVRWGPIARFILAAAMMIAVPALAQGSSPPGAASCLGCHPAAAADGPVAALAKLPARQIVAALQAYRSGTRPATVMDRIAKGFSDEEIDAIAQWYARANNK
jgi:cytochrome subunit of sulfide dehydrogenase